MSPQACLASQPKPCFVCSTPTRRIRSMSHLHGPPSDAKDMVRICLQCDEDWTTAVTRELIDISSK